MLKQIEKIKAYKYRIIGVMFIVLTILFSWKKITDNDHLASVYQSIQLSGKGTEQDPYLISDIDDLIYFRDLVNEGSNFDGRYLLQTADIDLSSIENWEPIGKTYADGCFAGVYNGAGHCISNLIIHRKDDSGFFGCLEGVVLNLGISNGYIEGENVGAIACSGSRIRKGVIPAVINCYNYATLYGFKRAGGIVDSFEDGEVYNCWNGGEIYVKDYGNIGGICSDSADSIIDSYSVQNEINERYIGKFYQYHSVDENFTYTQLLNLGLVDKDNPIIDKYSLTSYVEDEYGNPVWEDVDSSQVFSLEGEGSEKSPYLITSTDDFLSFIVSVNEGVTTAGLYFQQMQDIDLSSVEVNSIGKNDFSCRFQGIYNGMGRCLSGISEVTDGNAALFSLLDGTIVNLQISDSSFIGNSASAFAFYVSSNGKIINCCSSTEYKGNLVSNFSIYNDGTIHSCIGNGKLDGNYSCGACIYGSGAVELCQCSTECTGTNFMGDSLNNALLTETSENIHNANLVKTWWNNRTLSVPLYKISKADQQRCFLTEAIGKKDKLEYIIKEYSTVFGIIFSCVLLLAIGIWKFNRGLLAVLKEIKLKKIKNPLRTPSDGIHVMFWGMVLCVTGLIIWMVVNKDATVSNYFINSDLDCGMDFFNSISYVRGKVPYTQYFTVYPPLANMFFYLLYCMIPQRVSKDWPDSFDEGQAFCGTDHDLRLFQGTMILFIIFIVLITLSIVGICLKICGQKKEGYYLAIAILLSYEMLYAFERGNIILLSLFLLMFFEVYRNSANRCLRELAYVALAVSAGIKLYPALFGIILLYEKKWKEAIRTCAYGIVCFVVPFFFFEGVEALKSYFSILIGFGSTSTDIYSTDSFNLSGLFRSVLHQFTILFDLSYPIEYENTDNMYYIISSIILIGLILSLFILKEHSEIFLTVFLIIMFIQNSSVYTAIFSIPVLIALIQKKTWSEKDRVLWLLLILLYLPLPVVERSQLLNMNFIRILKQYSLIAILVYWIIIVVRQYVILLRNELQGTSISSARRVHA